MKQKLFEYIKRVAIVFLVFVLGLLFMLLTDPQHLPLPLLIVPYLWLFMMLVLVQSGLFKYVFHRRLTRKSIISTGLIAAVPVLLIVLQSIHQLSIKDILLVVGLVLIASFYLSRLDLSS